MTSGGDVHVLFLRSDGKVLSSGDVRHGQSWIPDLEKHVRYVQVAAGWLHTILLRSDGTAVGVGNNHAGQCKVPTLSDDLDYVQVAAGGEHSLFLRSDGLVDSCGNWKEGARDVPRLPDGLTYVQISAGGTHSLLLRSDGQAMAIGDNKWGQCEVPPLPEGMTYIQVSAGREHSVLLRSDGRALAFGKDEDGQTVMPDPPVNGRFVRVAAGGFHTALQCDNGAVLSVGRYMGKDESEIDKPLQILDGNPEVLYMEAGRSFTAAIRSDGSAVVCAIVPTAQNNMPKVPPLGKNQRYVPGEEIVSHDPNTVLQMYMERKDPHLITITCVGLSGDQVYERDVRGADLAWELQRKLARYLGVPDRRLRVLLQNGCFLHWVDVKTTLDKLLKATAHFGGKKDAGEVDGATGEC